MRNSTWLSAALLVLLPAIKSAGSPPYLHEQHITCSASQALGAVSLDMPKYLNVRFCGRHQDLWPQGLEADADAGTLQKLAAAEKPLVVIIEEADSVNTLTLQDFILVLSEVAIAAHCHTQMKTHCLRANRSQGWVYKFWVQVLTCCASTSGGSVLGLLLVSAQAAKACETFPWLL